MTARTAARGPRLPLSLVVGRYFIYILLAAGLIACTLVLCLAGMMTSGFILPANDAERHVDALERTLSQQEAFDPEPISASFRYVVLDADGSTVLATDVSERWADEARRAVEHRGPTPPDMHPHREVALADGSTCVLFYGLMPTWADRGMRDSLPDPQTLSFLCFGGALVAVVAVTALRASSVLTRKMEPLVAAAQAVGAQDLDEPVGSSNVAQVDEVLLAMDRMRVSLKASLEEQWEAEQRYREHVTLMAHKLKTPLTVIQGNAELLLEDPEAVQALGEDAAQELAALRDAVTQADACVAGLISALRDAAE